MRPARDETMVYAGAEGTLERPMHMDGGGSDGMQGAGRGGFFFCRRPYVLDA